MIPTNAPSKDTPLANVQPSLAFAGPGPPLLDTHAGASTRPELAYTGKRRLHPFAAIACGVMALDDPCIQTGWCRTILNAG